MGPYFAGAFMLWSLSIGADVLSRTWDYACIWANQLSMILWWAGMAMMITGFFNYASNP